MKTKKLLALLLGVAMAFSLAVPAMAEEETPAEETVTPYTVPDDAKDSIVILHSNDVHGAIDGYAKMAALKAMYEAAGASVIVVDAGDYIQGDSTVSVSQGATAVELMNMVGYSLSALGNHEFDYGYENMKTLEEKADFEILAANILYNGEPAFGTNKIVEAAGKKIGFFGLDTPETATKAHPAKIQGVTFLGGEEMYACAQEQVDALKAEGAEIIVCLGHLGIDEETAATANRSIDLLEKVTGIDVFIDGHSHSTEEQIAEKTNEDRKVGDTVVTSTGTKFANIGVVTIKDGAITTECVNTETVTVAEDDAILARAAGIKAEIEADYGAVFAKSEVELNGNKAPGNRTEETNNGDLICDAMVWLATKDDLGVPAENVVAITNGGGIRDAIKVGDVTKKDVNTVLPFGNTVAVDYVTGAVLLEALEASTFCTPDAIGGFPQVAGIEFTVNTGVAYDAGDLYPGTTYAAPASINRVTINSINGKDFDPEATYAVVTNDFVAAGGDTYYAFSVSDRITDTGVPLDEAVMQYITDVLGGTITAEKYGEPAGRITIVNRPADLDENAWWYEAAVICLDAEIMKGTDKGFDADAKVTEATVLQTFYNAQNAPAIEEGTLTDVEDKWYADAANWAASVGMVEGTEFGEDAVITRGEIKDLLDIYCELTGVSSEGLMKGNENGDMMLDKELSRAEFAQVWVNLAMATAEAEEAA